MNMASGVSLKEGELLKRGMDVIDQKTSGIRWVWIFTGVYISHVLSGLDRKATRTSFIVELKKRYENSRPIFKWYKSGILQVSERGKLARSEVFTDNPV